MIRTTHVGSLPRPAAMITKQLRKELLSDDDLKTYVRELIERQLSLGLTFINNGELPRADYISSTGAANQPVLTGHASRRSPGTWRSCRNMPDGSAAETV